MKSKKLLSALLAGALMVTSSAYAFAKAVPAALADNVIYAEDFADNAVHTNYGGKYIVNTGVAENEAYTLNSGVGARILYSTNLNSQQINEISGGVVAIEGTFTFTKADVCGKLMAAADETGSSNAFVISTNNTSINLMAYDAAGNTQSGLTLTDYQVDTPYKLTAYLDLNSGRMQVAVNDNLVLADRELYINKTNYQYDGGDTRYDNISRVFDSDNRNGKADYIVDDISVKRIAHLPVSSTSTQLWSEDFSDFNAKSYAASTNVADNLVDFSNVSAADAENHGKVFQPVGGTRLLKAESTAPDGIYSIKSDWYFTNNTFNAVVQKITDNSGSMAAYIQIKNGQIGIGTAEATKYALTYELNKWYTIELRLNTSTREIILYINGVRYFTNETLLVKELSAYQRLFDMDNRSNTFGGLYVDNISVSKLTSFKTESDWENIITESDFANGTFNGEFNNFVSGNIEIKDGYAVFANGCRALYGKNITSGIYTLETDVRVAAYDETPTVIFGTAGDKNSQLVYNVYTAKQDLGVTSYTEDGQLCQNVIIQNYNTDEWYNIKVSFDMNSKRIHFYVNDLEVLADKELYMGNITEKVTRPYDFSNNKATSREYHIKNLKFYEDTLLEGLGVESGRCTSNITLPTTVNGKTVRWITNDLETLKADGTVNTSTSTAKYPTLQAMVEDGNGRATRRFTFYIPALEPEFSNKTGVVSDINDLPFVTSEGTLIHWESSNPEIVTATGAVTRPAETTVVTLTARYNEIVKNYTIEVIGMNTENKVFVTENALYADGIKLSGKSDINGTSLIYKAKLHNATENEISAAAILAVYKDGQLEKVQLSPEEKVSAKTSGKEMELAYSIPAEGNYSAKGMFWDMNTMKPYDDAVTTDDKTADLYVIADSLYANYAENAYNDEGGIGMYIGDYLTDSITVHNEAHGGASTRTYMKTYFKNILAAAETGDYMLIALGINDGSAYNKDRYTSEDDYKAFLSIYADAARDRGIRAFFVTPTPTGAYKDGAVTYSDNVPNRRTWMKEIAVLKDVKCLELGEKVSDELAALTPEEQYAKYIQEAKEAEGTMVHINKARASELAGWLTQMIKGENINGLSGYVK